MTPKHVTGLLLLCLMQFLLAACSIGPPPKPETVTLTEVVEREEQPPQLRRCEAKPARLRVNGDLLTDRNRYARELDLCDNQIRAYLEWQSKKGENREAAKQPPITGNGKR